MSAFERALVFYAAGLICAWATDRLDAWQFGVAAVLMFFAATVAMFEFARGPRP